MSTTEQDPAQDAQDRREPLLDQLRRLAPNVTGSSVSHAEIPQVLSALIQALDATQVDVEADLFEQQPELPPPAPTDEQERLTRIEAALERLSQQSGSEQVSPAQPGPSPSPAAPSQPNPVAPAAGQAEFHGTVSPSSGDPA